MIKDNEAKIQECLRKDLDRGEFDTAMTEVSYVMQGLSVYGLMARYSQYSVKLNLL